MQRNNGRINKSCKNMNIFEKITDEKISAIHNNEYAEINNDRINKSYKATSIKNYLKIILD